jgi:Sulfotransferase domain
MSVRSLVPKPLHGVARSTYQVVGGATSGVRMTPEFIVIGGQRCGTTSMFKNIAEHPQVLRPGIEKGIDWFTLHYDRDMSWYRSHFPVERIARLRTARHGRPVAFEACTYYMFHPFAMQRLADQLPDVKLVAMLRDPVERAFSAYKHELARGFETERDFATALALEDSRLEGEVEKMASDVTYESHAHRHHAYRRRGEYAEQLERVFALFPRERVHVVDSESYFASPEREYAGLLEFLELEPFLPSRFDRHNARPSKPMPAEAREMLTEHYAPHEKRLADLLGRSPAWATSS